MKTPENHQRKSGLLRLPQVLELVPVSSSTWWAGVKSGRFPPAIKLGPRITTWKADDIYRLIDGQEEPTRTEIPA